MKVTLLAACLLASPAFAAEDPGASFAIQLFGQACVPYLGLPAKIRAWAAQHQYPEIRDQRALALFVGEGNKGAAWSVRTASGDFVLSIRGKTEGCAVWARKADPVQIEANFKEVIKFVSVPGVVVTVDQNSLRPSPHGVLHTLDYNVGVPHAPTTLEFTMLTVDRPGGPFQASMQGAVAGAHP
jgi:hypothetical protein